MYYYVIRCGHFKNYNYNHRFSTTAALFANVFSMYICLIFHIFMPKGLLAKVCSFTLLALYKQSKFYVIGSIILKNHNRNSRFAVTKALFANTCTCVLVFRYLPDIPSTKCTKSDNRFICNLGRWF